MFKSIGRYLITASIFYGVTALALPTQVNIFKAFSNHNVLQPDLVIAQRYTGTCWTQSLANPGRPDAWRCMSSNLILDPCFQDGSRVLACVISPWNHRAALIEVATSLTKNPPGIKTTQAPWAIELSDGQLCTHLTGTSIVIDNARINYTCRDSRYSVIGDINRSSTTWTVKVYDFIDKIAKIIPIAVAWY